MKQIIEKGDNLIKYQDGSAKVRCSVCSEWEEVKAGSNQANLLQIEGKEKGWECRKCWLAKKDAPGGDNDKRRKEIAFAQAYNLAVQMVKEFQDGTDEKTKTRIREWQKFFYEELTKGENK